MKNKLKNKSCLVLILLFVITGTSCKKYLYETPLNAPYSDNFWTNEANVGQAMNAGYVSLRDCLREGSSHFIFGDLTTGMFNCSWNTDWTLNAVKSSNNPPFNFSYVPYREGTLQNWSRFYKLIALNNLILQKVPEIPDNLFASVASKNNYLGQALFLRAYAYFYMCRVWGDPVYVDKTYDDVDYGKVPPIARSTDDFVLGKCLTDLRAAANYLSYGGSSLYANKSSVYSLMANIFAWQSKYDSCHIYCQKVINEGGYTLEPMETYTNIWKGMESTENIWELPMKINDVSSYDEVSFGFFSVFLKDDLTSSGSHIEKKNAWIFGNSWDWLFDAADARRAAILHPVAASGDNSAGYLVTKYSNFGYKTPNTFSNPYINNNLVLFRLSDIILLDAEAEASLGHLEEARTLLQMTEERAGIESYTYPENQYDMLDEVVMERGRELLGEGIWYYDLIRTESRQSWLSGNGYPSIRVTKENRGYLWPLDMTSLFPYDNLLVQLPWWQSHK